MANEVDQPIAELITDLKQRGLLDSTLIVFASEFGRTPGLETVEIQAGTHEGRDHHPFGFISLGYFLGSRVMARNVASVT